MVITGNVGGELHEVLMKVDELVGEKVMPRLPARSVLIELLVGRPKITRKTSPQKHSNLTHIFFDLTEGILQPFGGCRVVIFRQPNPNDEFATMSRVTFLSKTWNRQTQLTHMTPAILVHV